jgi:cellulose synthase/poly-beta-1,6-N-acetylglucosamine synthase-like glycosyltransferase
MPLLETVEICQGAYRIRKSAGEPVPLELHPDLFKLSNVISWGLWLLYIVFQFGFAWSVQSSTPTLLWRMWIVLFAEFCLSFQEVVLAVNTILALFGAEDTRGRPWYRLIGNSVPSVDVLVPCCGEPADVVLDTVAAAVAQDYPHQRFRVFVLDDARDDSLQDAVQVLGKKSAEKNGPQVRYLSRDPAAPGVKSYFKAGNLQFGIEETKLLGGSEYLASLDADMIPEPDWLRRMIPHLVLEDKAALACPPQVFENRPSSGHPSSLIRTLALLQRPRRRSIRSAGRIRYLVHHFRTLE